MVDLNRLTDETLSNIDGILFDLQFVVSNNGSEQDRKDAMESIFQALEEN